MPWSLFIIVIFVSIGSLFNDAIRNWLLRHVGVKAMRLFVVGGGI